MSRWLACSSSVRCLSDCDRASKKTSWAARNCFQRSSSPSRPVRGTAFQRSIRFRMAALVGPHSVEVDSRCASLISSCLAPRASPRWASSEAKCVPRRRPKASRAAANRVQSASSVLRSMPRMAFHSSTIALRRSPADFQDVDSAAICSASAASASLRAIWAARAAAFSARDSAAALSAVRPSPAPARPARRGRRPQPRWGWSRRAPAPCSSARRDCRCAPSAAPRAARPRWPGRRSAGRSGPGPRPVRRPARSRRRARRRRCGRRRCRRRRPGPTRRGRSPEPRGLPRARVRPGGGRVRPSAARPARARGGPASERPRRRARRDRSAVSDLERLRRRERPPFRAGSQRCGHRRLRWRPALGDGLRRLGAASSGLGGRRRLGAHRLRRIVRRLRNRRSGLLRPVAGVVRARHAGQCPTPHPGHCRRDRHTLPPADARPRSWPGDRSAPGVAVVGPTATGKTALAVAAGPAARRRGGQRRLDAALPRHGHRNREARPVRARRRAASPARPLARAGAGVGGRVPGAGARGDRPASGRRRGAAAGGRLGALPPGRARRARLPGHRPRVRARLEEELAARRTGCAARPAGAASTRPRPPRSCPATDDGSCGRWRWSS